MFVKQITICGFKSYREVVAAGPFSEGHNVIVGRNGSGKSNFFDAVRFVLSDTFASLRAEDRIALLHEGAGAPLLSAYVEIVFDNSDGRLPFEKDDVALRRMIGLKKDEYVLDRKNVTRTEVFNLLESAGFSRSNPYYIVQQGKVASLVSMTDAQRLDLLREVAGTKVYDERRTESLKLMEETDGKREKITEVVEYIEERLSELESEKEELREFQVLDKDRRAIEYTIYVKELEETKAKIDEIENARAEQHEQGLDLYRLFRENETRMHEGENSDVSFDSKMKRLHDESVELSKEQRVAMEAAARLQVDVHEAEDATRSGQSVRRTAENQLEDVRKTIEDRKTELEPLRSSLEAAKQVEEEAQKAFNKKDKRILDLRVKAGRSAQFATKEERDNHLRTKIEEADKLLEESRKQLDAIMQEETSVQQSLNRRGQEGSEKERAYGLKVQQLENINEELGALKKLRDDLYTLRQELWRSDADLDAKIKTLIDEVTQQERVLRGGLGGSVFSGIKCIIEACKEDEELARGYFGPVYEIISVNEKFATAVDTAAGGALSYVVVNTDDTAAKLVSLLQQRKAGRLTFIPLNRLQPQRIPPVPASQDAIPLVSKVKCDEHLQPAMQQIFGSTMIARSVAVASQLSRQSQVDCVTLDGDLVNRRGAMTGGFLDARKSRLEAAMNLKKVRTIFEQNEAQLKQIREQIQDVDAKLANATAEFEIKQSQRKAIQIEIGQLQAEAQELSLSTAKEQKVLETIRSRLASLQESVNESESDIRDMENEINSELTSRLSNEEETELQELVENLPQLQDSLTAAYRERAQREVEVEKITDELETNLEKRASELEQTIRVATRTRGDPTTDAVATLASKREELKAVEETIKKLQSAIDAKEQEMKSLEDERRRNRAVIDECRAQDSRLSKRVSEQQERVETLFNRRAMHIQKKDDLEKRVRELGSLPSDFEKHRSLGPDTLMKNLNRTNEKLKKYSHVNKKALDQYMSFTEQRDTLQKRRKELDDGSEAIKQLIGSLDTRKDEDIMRTFKGVSKNFSEVFSELVPGGRASLVMHRGDQEGGRVSYTGVSMKVSFAGSGESYMLNQLSGGQKSIVALTLIFAIQRLDPAPFYLFDEIDANLDASHRQAVADLIKKQCGSNTQFITTTFRPEFVNTADKLFGVTHRNKISRVDVIEKEEALEFIMDAPAR